MPVHLPALTRRGFIRRSLWIAGGVAFGAELLHAGALGETSSWALLSDTHLAANASLTARGINMTANFKQASAEVVGLPGLPAGVLITGDCAYNTGELADYAHVADLLQPMRRAGLPIHLALGNHDNRDRFWESFKDERAASRPLADRQVALIRTPRFNWFILDSLEATLSSPGLLGPEQLTWLTKALDENSSMPALVVIHHNPGLNGGNLGLKDTLPLFEVIRPRKQVKAYIYGHTHAWKTETDVSGIHLVNLPPVSYVFREGLPSGWVLATIGDSGMQLELRCIDHTRKDHGQKVELPWRT
ncbi:MAG TPA: metallophosphoesterase [Verrucomicrobiae bacterium]|nr:metallophosphoesterase [Verrucomicrobiae bacterium]